MDIIERRKIYNTVLLEMPDTFTSLEFTSLSRDYGVPDKLLRSGDAGLFLQKFCVNEGMHSKTWHKKISKSHAKTLEGLDSKEPKLCSKCSDEDCIEKLKAKGYKILKQK